MDSAGGSASESELSAMRLVRVVIVSLQTHGPVRARSGVGPSYILATLRERGIASREGGGRLANVHEMEGIEMSQSGVGFEASMTRNGFHDRPRCGADSSRGPNQRGRGATKAVPEQSAVPLPTDRCRVSRPQE